MTPEEMERHLDILHHEIVRAIKDLNTEIASTLEPILDKVWELSCADINTTQDSKGEGI